MDAPRPVMLNEVKNETILLNFSLAFNLKNYKCEFLDIDKEAIKINIISPDNKEKYENQLNFNDFKLLNKYFKMFDTLKELEDDLLRLKNSNRFEILNINEFNLNLCINVLTLDDNKVIIRLNKRELSDKEKLNKLLKENEEIRKELNMKDIRINELEKKIELLANEFYNFKNNINNNNNFVNNNVNNNNIEIKKEKQIDKNIEEKNMLKYKDMKFNYLNLEFKSSIFLNQYEKEMVLNQISNKIKSVKILFSSENSGSNVSKLKSAYLNRANLLFAIKTKKGKRFGAYCKETFENKLFNKSDRNAFLFSLDNMKIMKSKMSKFDIWKQSDDSIDFGSGTDLRIFYDFYTNKNYAFNGTNSYDYINCNDYVLNDEHFFTVNILEIFQVYI